MSIEYEKGSILDINIGSAIAIEALVVMESAPKENALYINVRTLLRNLVGSIEDPYQYTPDTIAEILLQEMEDIQGVISSALSKLSLHYYIMSLKSLQQITPLANHWVPTTKRQLQYDQLEHKVLSIVEGSAMSKSIEVFDTLIQGANRQAFIITHYPLDLLSRTKFRSLTLLESHTGAFKQHKDWITKLNRNPDYSNLPFNLLTMQLIGDGGVLFKSSGLKWVRPYVELATKKRWTRATQYEKIRYDIRGLKDREVAERYNQLLTAKLR